MKSQNFLTNSWKDAEDLSAQFLELLNTYINRRDHLQKKMLAAYALCFKINQLFDTIDDKLGEKLNKIPEEKLLPNYKPIAYARAISGKKHYGDLIYVRMHDRSYFQKPDDYIQYAEKQQDNFSRKIGILDECLSKLQEFMSFCTPTVMYFEFQHGIKLPSDPNEPSDKEEANALKQNCNNLVKLYLAIYAMTEDFDQSDSDPEGKTDPLLRLNLKTAMYHLSLKGQEQQLFDIWSENKRLPLIRDGIFDEKIWINQNLKILYLFPEASWIPQNTTSVLTEFLLSKTYHSEQKQWNLIAEWTKVLLTNDDSDPAISDYEERNQWLKKTAFMNLKKEVGNPYSEKNPERRVVEEDKVLLLRQLEMYRPDIILCCEKEGRACSELIRQELFSDQNCSSWKTPFSNDYISWYEVNGKNIKVFSVTHPGLILQKRKEKESFEFIREIRINLIN